MHIPNEHTERKTSVHNQNGECVAMNCTLIALAMIANVRIEPTRTNRTNQKGKLCTIMQSVFASSITKLMTNENDKKSVSNAK